MSSLITQAFLFERYGPRLDIKQLAEALGLAAGTVKNRISAGTLGIPTYLDGQRYADYRHVAQYLDDCYARASAQAGAGSPA